MALGVMACAVLLAACRRQAAHGRGSGGGDNSCRWRHTHRRWWHTLLRCAAAGRHSPHVSLQHGAAAKLLALIIADDVQAPHMQRTHCVSMTQPGGSVAAWHVNNDRRQPVLDGASM